MIANPCPLLLVGLLLLIAQYCASSLCVRHHLQDLALSSFINLTELSRVYLGCHGQSVYLYLLAEVMSNPAEAYWIDFPCMAVLHGLRHR